MRMETPERQRADIQLIPGWAFPHVRRVTFYVTRAQSHLPPAFTALQDSRNGVGLTQSMQPTLPSVDAAVKYYRKNWGLGSLCGRLFKCFCPGIFSE